MPGEFEAATGWSLRPEGFCRGDICVPVPPGRAHEFVAGGAVNAAAFWGRMGNPVAHDAAREVWVLGTAPPTAARRCNRWRRRTSLCPTWIGRTRTLSEHRGKKVLLATWASW